MVLTRCSPGAAAGAHQVLTRCACTATEGPEHLVSTSASAVAVRSWHDLHPPSIMKRPHAATDALAVAMLQQSDVAAAGGAAQARRDLTQRELKEATRRESNHRKRVQRAASPLPCRPRVQVDVTDRGPAQAPKPQTGASYEPMPKDADLNVAGRRVLATAEVPFDVVGKLDQAFLLNYMATAPTLLPGQVRPSSSIYCSSLAQLRQLRRPTLLPPSLTLYCCRRRSA